MAALARTRAAHDERELEQQKCLCGTESRQKSNERRRTKETARKMDYGIGKQPTSGLQYPTCLPAPGAG